MGISLSLNIFLSLLYVDSLCQMLQLNENTHYCSKLRFFKQKNILKQFYSFLLLKYSMLEKCLFLLRKCFDFTLIMFKLITEIQNFTFEEILTITIIF